MGMSVGIAAWLGGTALFTAGSTATIVVAGAISGAIIGAAIGGISAAFTGGDIGKGMLYGAVGGAVMGGLSSYLGTLGGGGGGGGMVKPDAVTGAAPQVTNASQLEAVTTGLEGNALTTTPVDTGGLLSGVSQDTIAQVGSQAVSGLAKGLLDTSAEDAADAASISQQSTMQREEAARLGRLDEIREMGTERRKDIREQEDVRLEQQGRQADTISRLTLGG